MNDLMHQLGAGLLSFPVTHFNAEGLFDEPAYREHNEWLLQYRPAAIFAAGGTGEFFSLTLAEYAQVIAAAVQQVRRRVPVIAGCGYGTAMAKEFCAAAENAGADGILVLPPYLVQPSSRGLVNHIKAVCASTSLGIIIYNRDNAVLDVAEIEQLCEECPNLIGFKDGVGDIERMTRIAARMQERLVYIGGLPTAETYALPYLEMGVTTYSSAIFNFLPQFAQDFYAAARGRDREKVLSMLRGFVLPYIEIRNSGKGYAVSIVKAGMRAVGRSAGKVRPPLTELSSEEYASLAALISRYQ